MTLAGGVLTQGRDRLPLPVAFARDWHSIASLPFSIGVTPIPVSCFGSGSKTTPIQRLPPL